MMFLSIEGYWRDLLMFLCEPIYKLIVILYELFEVIGTADILSSDILSVLYSRIGSLLGVYMMFRIIFSCIQMLINPDYVSDKEKGFGKIIFKVFMTILLLAVTPFIFEKAFELQNRIVGVNGEGNVIAKIVLPNQDSEVYKDFGPQLSAYVFENFYRYSEDAPEINRTCELFDENGETGINSPLHKAIIAGRGNVKSAKICLDDNWNVGKQENYVISFTSNGLFAVIVGLVICYVLLMYTLMVGARVIQLAFLRIISPMAILGYLSPKKDGMFEKWLKMCTTTYLDLFIRMAIIYFIVFMISLIIGNYNGIALAKDYDQMWIVNIVMILALLLFAKKAPELLKELFPKSGAASLGFGVKSPKGLLNDMLGGNILSKGYDKAIGFGKSMAKGAVGFGIGSLVGGAGNAIRGAINDKDNRARGFFGGLAGGAFSGGLAGAKSKGIIKSFGASNKAATAQSKRIADWRADGGVSTLDRWGAGIQQKFGLTTEAKRLDLEKATLEAENSAYKNFDGYIDAAEKRAESQILKGAFKGNIHADEALRQKSMADIYRQQSANVKLEDFTVESNKANYFDEINKIYKINKRSPEFLIRTRSGEIKFNEAKYAEAVRMAVEADGNKDNEYLISFESFANKNYENALQFYADKASSADSAYLNEMKAAKKDYISEQLRITREEGIENSDAPTVQILQQAAAVVDANVQNENYAFVDNNNIHIRGVDLLNGDYNSFDVVNTNAKTRQTENNNRLTIAQSEGKAARADDKYSGSGKS